MPLDTNTAALSPALAARTDGGTRTDAMTPDQRREVGKKLREAASTIVDNVVWGDVRRAEGEAEGTAFGTVYGILRLLAHAVETYTPPIPAPAPAPVYEWGQRVMAMRHGRPVEAFLVSGPDGNGHLKVAFRGVAYAVCVRAKDVSPITPAAAPEPVAPPAPRQPQVGDLVRFKVHYGLRRPGDLGTIIRIDPSTSKGLPTIYEVESPGFAADAHCFGSRFDVIRPAGWTPKVGDKVKVVGLSYVGFEAGDVVGTVDHVEASVSHPILLRFPGEYGRKNYKPEQVYPASL